MSLSPYLGIQLLQQAQNLKYLTVNNAIVALDSAMNGVFQQAMADADQTPSQATALGNLIIQCQGNLTADRALILPNIKKIYVVHNLTGGGHNIIVKTVTPQRQLLIPVAEDIVTGSLGTVFGVTGAQFLYCDGQNNFWAIQ